MPFMSQQSWTIGSTPSCDLVVQSPAVSAQHCRLRHEDTQTLLTDLGSTNGTFVNGQRLSGSKAVSTGDRITLGHDQPMPWPDALKPERVDQSQHQSTSVTTDKSKQIITVGRASDNTVVLHEANVSSYHARMSIKGGEITIEDLGSTNGTAVGSGENKI